MNRATAAGPDFICIGMDEAGTDWLHDQLARHPSFWLPAADKLNFFSAGFPSRDLRKRARLFLTDPTRSARQHSRAGLRPASERDRPFYERILADGHDPRDLTRYKALFSSKGDSLSGDITPAYHDLDEGMIAFLADALPEVRIVLLARDPAERVWAEWCRATEKGERSTVDDLASFRAFVESPEVMARSFPSRVAERWMRCFGRRVGVFLFDDVLMRPVETCSAVIRFIGGDEAAAATGDPERAGGWTGKPSSPRSPEIDAFLRAFFDEELKRCAGLFGGAATNWDGGADAVDRPRAGTVARASAALDYPVRVINLDRDVERLDRIRGWYAEQGVTLTRFPGIVGADLDPLQRFLFVPPGEDALPGTVGCALSHIGVWLEIAEGDDDHALILEDDAKPIRALPRSAYQIAPADFDVLFVNHRMLPATLRRQAHPSPALTLIDALQARTPQQKGIGADGYFVSKRGARKLIAAAHQDRFMGHVDRQLITYGLTAEDCERLDESRPSLGAIRRWFGRRVSSGVCRSYVATQPLVSVDDGGRSSRTGKPTAGPDKRAHPDE